MNLKKDLSDLQQKARERTVKTQNIEYDLETIVKKVKRGIIKLDPDYQRRHRWDKPTSSRLIESLILNIPIPLIYLSQDIDVDTESIDEEARYSVIDGQQRLTAIINFFDGKFALTELQALKELQGFKYKELPPFLIRRLEERTIKCLRIDSTLDEQVKYDIFERLNSGSVKLEAQELRNAIARGPFNDLIKELAKDENFRSLIQVKNPEKDKKVKKMQDVELVLRFFALNNNKYHNIKRGFKQFLDDEIKDLNSSDNTTLIAFKRKFIITMKAIRTRFGDEAFAKYRYDPESNNLVQMSKFNAAVYDALAIATSMNIDLENPSISTKQKNSFKNLFKNDEFFDAVEGSVNDKEKVVKRIEAASAIFLK